MAESKENVKLQWKHRLACIVQTVQKLAVLNMRKDLA